MIFIAVECDVSCITVVGYYLNTELCRCEFNNVCEMDTPCDNGGICTPDSAPNNDYQCMCANQYGSENCTGMRSDVVCSIIYTLCIMCNNCRVYTGLQC